MYILKPTKTITFYAQHFKIKKPDTKSTLL